MTVNIISRHNTNTHTHAHSEHAEEANYHAQFFRKTVDVGHAGSCRDHGVGSNQLQLGGIKAIDREAPLTCLTGQVYVLLEVRLKRRV